VGFRDKILRAIDTGPNERLDPNEVVVLAYVAFESGPLALRHLKLLAIPAETLLHNPSGRPHGNGKHKGVEIRVRRADFERAAFHLDEYLRTTQNLAWFHISPTIAAVDTSTARLLAALRRLDDAAFRQPSRLPGWSVAHVVAHVSQHAEALARCADSLRHGEKAVMYPAGLDARAEAIEEASRLPVAELVDRLERTSTAFAESWSDMTDGYCRSVPDSTPFPTNTVLLRRLREVEVHGSDTGLAALDSSSWSPAFVGTDLTNQWDTVNRRTSASVHLIDEMGGVWRAGDDSAPALDVTRRNVLAWLLDRHSEPGLPTLTTWGDQSRWGR
jgi:maleylpyruvate isomerase